jgi:hypothetical protein
MLPDIQWCRSKPAPRVSLELFGRRLLAVIIIGFHNYSSKELLLFSTIFSHFLKIHMITIKYSQQYGL